MQIRCFRSRLFRWEHPDSERGDSYGHFDTTLALPWGGGGVHVGPRWPTDYCHLWEMVLGEFCIYVFAGLVD